MSHVAAPPRRWLDNMFQMRLSVFVFTVAGCALICWAVLFYRANMDPTRAMLSHQFGNLTSSSVKERRMAARQLDGIPVALINDGAKALLNAMRDSDAEVRASASFSLATSLVHYFVATGGEVPPPLDAASLALISAMSDPEPVVRVSAAIGLNLLSQTTMVAGGKTKTMGLNPKIAVPALVKALDGTDMNMTLQALRSLKSTGADLAPSLPALRRLSRELGPLVRVEAVTTIAAILRAQKEPPGEILPFLDDPDVRVRVAAAKALHTPWRDADAVALALAKRLDRCFPEERFSIVWALFTNPKLPAEVVPALVRVLEGEGKDVPYPLERANIAEHAAVAIGHAPPSAARAALAALVRRTTIFPGGSVAAARVVVTIAPDSAEAKSLVEPLRWTVVNSESSGQGQIEAANILGMLGPRAAEAAPELLQAAVSVTRWDNQRLPPTAALALKEMGPKAAFAAPTLAQFIRDRIASEVIPKEHIDALVTIAPNSPEVADLLMEMAGIALDEANPFAQKVYGYLMGFNGDRVLGNPALRAALTSDDAERRARAKTTMEKIGIP